MKKQKRLQIVVVACAILLLAGTLNPPLGRAQTKPNFTGNWSLDKSRSDFGRFAKEAASIKITMKITHREPELKMVRTGSLGGAQAAQTLTYFTDGRGETNPGLLTNTTASSKTRWEGARLSSRSVSSITFEGQSFQLETIERRELSADGKTLTVSVIASSPRGLDRVKLVFARQ